MERSVVRFENVSKRYQMREAVKNISFELPHGKVIGFVGANGSGKSTTLKLMAGLLRPSQGEIFVNEQSVTRRISHVVSFLSDTDAVYPFLTVEQMVQYYQQVFSDFDGIKAREMLAFMKLDPKQTVKSLSKGNVGRLKIVLTVARKAPLIVMDEPLSGLDPLVRQSIMKGLISFVDFSDQTIIMSTHEIAEVEPLLDLVVLIEKGEVKAIEFAEDIRTRYNKNIIDWMAEKLKV